jgi:hypothetical protein
MQIERHDKSYIVKLEDGSNWKIWPGDIALTLDGRTLRFSKFRKLTMSFVHTLSLTDRWFTSARDRSKQGLARPASPAIL